ncbi:hypothetical protein JCM10212_004780 [Sporobolomyces blumeae]
MARSRSPSPTRPRSESEPLEPSPLPPPSEPSDPSPQPDGSPLSLSDLSKDQLVQLVEKFRDAVQEERAKVERLEGDRDGSAPTTLRRRRRSKGSPDEGEADSPAHPDEDAEIDSAEKVREEYEAELDEYREREEEWRREQARLEEELAGRIEVVDKLRSSVRELERDKRDATKRYREQADSFDSERQSWYDQEQHYKVRIANLSEERKKLASTNGRRPREPSTRSETGSDAERDREPDDERDPKTPTASKGFAAEQDSPTRHKGTASARSSSPSESIQGPTATELALREQLDSLTTAHSSLTSTLRTLQTEMMDLKRVYQDLQEENESYEILLGEKTLSGEVTGTDFFRKSFSWGESGEAAANGGGAHGGWSGFGFQGGLEAVGEEDLEDVSDEDDDASSTDGGTSDGQGGGRDSEDVEKILLESKGTGSLHAGAVSAQDPSRRRRSSRRSRSIALAHAKRDSLASSASGMGGLGGGLDLAAELEAAQKDEELDEIDQERKREKDERRAKRKEEKERKKREARAARRDGSQSMPVGIEELHLEIKQLREANKALTLYVSKIVDRVCSQEGFEKVLAVDYRNTTPKVDPPTPEAAAPAVAAAPDPAPTKKPRPVSTFFSRSPNPSSKEPATPTVPLSAGLAATPSSTSSVSTATTSGPRRSGGLTWDGISSVFGFGSSSSTPTSNSTPTTSLASKTPDARSTSLSPSPSSVSPTTGLKPLALAGDIRRLSISDEDEDDMLERERLRADLSRHGIDYAPTLAQIGRPRSSTGTSPLPSPALSTPDPVEQAEHHLKQRELEEESIKRQMREGKGSGFTDPPQKRMSRLERRHSSKASSISYNHTSSASSSTSIAGLGIDAPSPSEIDEEREDRRFAEEPRLGGAESPETTNGEQQGPGWTKALRRMSRGWSSPPMA